MARTKEEKNKEAINTFLKYNNIEPHKAMGYNTFETAYYVGSIRKFLEETPVGFNIVGTHNSNVSLHEINNIEFETELKITEQDFHFDEDHETLIITGSNSQKHNETYKIVISSIYID
ncbi:hypothetical protein JHD48_07370 [Sulfurimonas sp. SAG-AH-194-I05]|nr:hypothetical protein [Sulfurimonas sp. SAG-AH-194-I05]MDF1875550.1 hypothetical protein [Sulfurimonas sp. SAG-AH-194-I05]